MSWSAFPPTRFIPTGTYLDDYLVSGYLAANAKRTEWSTPALGASNVRASTKGQIFYLPEMDKTQNGEDLPHLYSLGSACAATGCTEFRRDPLWRKLPGTLSKEDIAPAPVDSIVYVPSDISQMMAQIALASGRSERDLWVEAAGAWLSSHSYDDEPLPPAPSAALAIPTTNRSWDLIDDLLATLRTAPGKPGSSAEGPSERAA